GIGNHRRCFALSDVRTNPYRLFPIPDSRVRIPGVSYKKTLFDKYGPGAGDIIRAGAFGVMVFGITVFATLLMQAIALASGGSLGVFNILLICAGGLVLGVLCTLFSLGVAGAGGSTYKFLMMSGG